MKKACSFIVPFLCYWATYMLSKAIPHARIIMMLKLGETHWVQGKLFLSQEKISEEVRLMNDFRAREKSAKLHQEISKFIKVPQLASCRSDSLYNTKNASADTVENNSTMHYLSNNSNDTNNSLNNVGPSPAKSLLIFLSVLLVQLFCFPCLCLERHSQSKATL